MEKKRGEGAAQAIACAVRNGRVLRGEPRMAPYAQVDRDLGKLLMEFGPRRQSYHAEYPFWRLQNDDLWELDMLRG